MAGTVAVFAGAPFRFPGINGTLVWDGQRMYVEPMGKALVDGTYSLVTIKNGGIVAVGQASSPGYTPGVCG